MSLAARASIALRDVTGCRVCAVLHLVSETQPLSPEFLLDPQEAIKSKVLDLKSPTDSCQCNTEASKTPLLLLVQDRRPLSTDRKWMPLAFC